MSARMRSCAVTGSNGKVSLSLLSIALSLKMHPLPLNHCWPVRGGAVVGFTVGKGCPEHMLVRMRHAHISCV